MNEAKRNYAAVKLENSQPKLISIDVRRIPQAAGPYFFCVQRDRRRGPLPDFAKLRCDVCSRRSTAAKLVGVPEAELNTSLEGEVCEE